MAKEAERAPSKAPQRANEAELREALTRAESLRQELSALEGQREFLAELMGDVSRSLTTLTALKTAKEGDEILLPVGAGTFVHAKLASPGVAITTLGSNIRAELPLEAVDVRLRERAQNLEQAATRTSSEMNRLLDEMNRINAMLEQAQGA